MNKPRNGNYINLPLGIIKEMYLNGCTIQEIANKYYVCHSTIAARLKEIGIKASQRLENRTEFIKNEVKKLYTNTNITVDEIAKKLRAHPTTVYKYAKEFKLHRPKANKEIYLGKRFDKDKFIELHSKYDEYERIASKLNISVASVRKYVIILGLPRKLRKKCIINESNQEEFIEMYNNRDNLLSNIALHFNTSVTVIRNSVKRLGLPPRRT